jgi:hypothetical protein
MSEITKDVEDAETGVDDGEVPETVEDTTEAAADVTTEVAAEANAELPAETAEVVAPEAAPQTVPVPAPAPVPETAPAPAPALVPPPLAAEPVFVPATTFVPPFGESTPIPALTEPSPPKPKKKFPWRWIGAAVTMLAVGAGCAFAVMAPQRTELPGLKTASDGRYTFAPLVLPTLAPGQSGPNSVANAGAQHISDIRKLLLSPPKGAVLDHALPGTTGWVSRSATLAVLGNEQAAEQLSIDGWRHTAGIAWKTPDGAETKIWLVQFIDSSAGTDASMAFSSFNGGSTATPTSIAVANTTTANYVRVVKGSTATWYGQVNVEDTEALVEFTAPTSVGITPFEQELDLQVEMLQ